MCGFPARALPIGSWDLVPQVAIYRTRKRFAIQKAPDFCRDLLDGFIAQTGRGYVGGDGDGRIGPEWMIGRQRLLSKNVKGSPLDTARLRSEEHTYELQSLMSITY